MERNRTTRAGIGASVETEEECRRRPEDCLMFSERERRVMLAPARRWKALAEAVQKAQAENPDQSTDLPG